MKTLLEIQTSLKEIASNSNITGPAIDALILLLSESVYRGQIGNVTELLEGSFSRCRTLNSSITHSFDRCYSVFRGRNQMFKLVNVASISTMNVKKFDVAVEVGGFKLVYAEDYSFDSMKNIDNVYLILCDSIYTKDITLDTFDLFKADFIFPDISESISIYRDNLGEFIQTEHSRVFGDCVKGLKRDNGETYFPLWVGTRENFGVSVVAINEMSKFKVNESVRIRYLKYTDKTINVSSIPPIPGFISTIVSVDGEEVSSQDSQTNIYNFEDLGILKRETTLSEIFKNANSTFLTQGVIKSYNDVANAVKERFGSMIGDLDISFDFTTHLNPNTNEPDPLLLISYTDSTYVNSQVGDLVNEADEIFINKNSVDRETIAFTISDFSSEMKDSYFIDEDIYFVKPKDVAIPTPEMIGEYSVKGNPSDYVGKIMLHVYYTGLTAPEEEIGLIIDNYNKKISKNLNLSKVAADFQAVDSVKFVEFFLFDGENIGEEMRLSSIDLSEKSYETGSTEDDSKRLHVGRIKRQKTDFTVEYYSFDKYSKKY